VFDFADGRLTNRQSVAPGGGIGFGPRHIDFSRDGRFVYASLERENALYTFGLKDGMLTADPLFKTTTLAEPGNVRPGQAAGPIHVSADGRFVYVSNRSDGTTDYKGQKVWVGGENSIAVFSLDPDTGEPKHVQSADPHSFHVRTFSLDPAAPVLVTAAVLPLAVRDGDQVRTTPAALTVFRVTDGTLAEVRKYDVDTAKGALFWCAILPL
jgi:6-phosphogluconolactonase